ncbi:hypothetical protein SAMN05216223_12847 [Actinacidiphila yanglinensis]|uniref:Gram-positive cocci surface proteins LPxTG domain-containing protein n=1 Tax=Actinacidiphila yanglinensis TaxID=310779 RepID=A0A1H6E7I0_9ACTN|nr:hypothetical protein [Actinacidiphila yanglinensis]SEG93672.1 hypothetical protein SAMN05216223_12847 [Actinacidiphila yanglinensis]
MPLRTLLTRRRPAAALTACAVALLGAVAVEPSARAATQPTLPLVAVSTDVGLPQPATPDDPPQISWSLAAPGDGTAVTDVDVTLDVSGISSFADDGGQCRNDVCEWKTAALGVGGTGGLVELNAKAGVPLGTTGTAVLSGTAQGAALTPVTVKVTVGRVGLVVNDLPPVGHATPGSTLDAGVTVANTGQLPSDGVDLRLTTTEGLGFAQHFSNCVYSRQTIDNGYPSLTDDALCHIATIVQPGGKYRLSGRIGIDVTPRALWDLVRYTAVPGSGSAPTGDGSGPVLSLVPDGAAPTGGEDSADWTVDTDNTADLAAGGDTARGRPGDRVVVTASMRSDGPATVDVETSDNQLGVMVDIPHGTTAVKVPGACNPWATDGPGRPALGAPRYICAVQRPFEANQVVRLPFTLRIDAGAPALATGSVKATTVYDLGLPFDPDHANDTAPLTVHVQGGATTPTPSPSAGGAGVGDGSGGNRPSAQAGTGHTPGTDAHATGGDGSLATTGNTGTWILTWTGAAALAFGGAAFALARSRRTRRTGN